MQIGVPKELKTLEGRVGLTPSACALLIKEGHGVFIETQAGVLSGYSDDEYRSVGCVVLETPASLYKEALLIVKVKEPIAEDVRYIESHHIVFSFLHLAANKQLVDELLESGCTAIAFESVLNDQNQRPILGVMSQIAGRLSVQIGTHLLHQSMGGEGILLGGVANADSGHVVVVGAGQAGHQAAELATCIGSKVTILDIDANRLQQLKKQLPAISIKTSSNETLSEVIASADLVIGAVLIPDKHAPKLITEEMVKSMKKGSVIVDIAIDQGGCVETMRPTNYEDPTFIKHGVIHFGVTNMPGAVPRTASQVLSSIITPSVMKIASSGGLNDDIIKKAINIQAGVIVHPALIDEFNKKQ